MRGNINARCLPCHSAYPTDETFRVAPNGVMFDTLQEIDPHVSRIGERAAVQRTMPPGNKTGMTDAERDLLGRCSGAVSSAR